MTTLAFEAIGTQWNIELPKSAEETASTLFSRIRERIEQFEQTYSRFRGDSLVTSMSLKAGTYELADDAETMISLYEKLYRITDGAFTPLIGSVLSEAGYDAVYSLKPRVIHKPPTWEEALEYQFPLLTLKKPALLDFGSIGKGYLIDIVGEMIEETGIESYTINAGGDIRYRNADQQILRVGLENPANFREVIGIATVAEGSLCGSSGSRRAWDEFHHIMDPRTLASPRHIISAWTTASSTIIADALATCLYLVPPETLIPHFEFEYLILRPDFSVVSSPGFQAELFGK